MSKLCGRDREWASVLRFLSAPGGILVLDGPPWFGKARVLEAAVGAARDRGYTPLLARAPGEVDPAALRRAPRPLLALNDAHADPPALLHLLPVLREPNVTGLLAMTSSLAGDEVRRGLAGADVLPLGPVDPAAVERALRELLELPPHPDFTALAATAGGNPRMLAELVAGLREEDRVEVHDGTARPVEGPLPRRVRGLIGSRVDALPPDAARLLRGASALGAGFRPHDAAAVAGTGATPEAVRALIASGIVLERGERLEFCSELVRRAVAEAVPAPAPCPPPAAPHSDTDRALLHRVRALSEDGRLAEATGLATSGLTGAAPDVTALLHVELAGIRFAEGDAVGADLQAAKACSTRGAEPGTRALAEALRLLANYFTEGPLAGALALSVLSARGQQTGDPDVVMAASVRSCLEWSAGNLAESLYWGREATRWEPGGPTTWWQSYCNGAFALKLSALGEFAQAERLVRPDDPAQPWETPPGARALRLFARARVQLQSGRLVQAQVTGTASLALARGGGIELLIPLLGAVLSTAALLRGDLAAAAEHGRRCLEGPFARRLAELIGQPDWVLLRLAEAQDGPARAAELARGCAARPGALRRVLMEESTAAPWLVRVALAVGDAGLADLVVDAAADLAAANPGTGVPAASAAHARALRDHDPAALRTATTAHRHPLTRALACEDLAELLAGRGDAAGAAEQAERALRGYERMGAEREAARLRARTTGAQPV